MASDELIKERLMVLLKDSDLSTTTGARRGQRGTPGAGPGRRGEITKPGLG